MGLFLVLYWCSAAIGGVLEDNSHNSRLSVFNSRLGPNKFPFCPTGIGGQLVDFPDRFRRFWRESVRFPVSTGKPGNGPEHYPIAEKPPSTGIAAPVTKSA